MKKVCKICERGFESFNCSKYCSDRCKREAKILKQYAHRMETKRKVFIHYGGNPPKCACCNESHIEFLELDHVNGGGNKDRKKLFKYYIGGSMFYDLLIKNNFPDGFQVLCSNCNKAKGDNKTQFCLVHHPELYKKS